MTRDERSDLFESVRGGIVVLVGIFIGMIFLNYI